MEGVELDYRAHQLRLAEHGQLLEMARAAAMATLHQTLGAEAWVETEEYSHSLHLLEEVGELYATTGLQTPEGRLAEGALRENVESSLIEMLHTDREFRSRLEINRERRHAIVNGHIMAHDGKTTVIGLCRNGAVSARQEADKDPRMAHVAARCEADVRTALAVEKLPVGSVHVAISNYIKEGMERYGTKFYEDLGFRPKLGFLQWYYKVDAKTVIAASYSIDDCDIDNLKQAFTEFGGHIPDGEVTDRWLDHAIQAKLTEAQARDMVVRLRERFYALRGINQKRYSADEFMAINKAVTDEMFGLYLELARSYYQRRKSPAMHAMVEGLLMSPQGLKQAVRQQLLGIYGSQALNKEGAALLEQLIRYATAERLRTALHLIGTESRPVVKALAVPPGANPLEYLARSSAGNILDGARAGRTYGGCTRSIDLAENPDYDESLDPNKNPQEAFGGKGTGDGKEKWVWKRGLCQIDNCPTRPLKTLVGPCSVCWKCQKKYDIGLDPAEYYARVSNEAAIRAMADRLLHPFLLQSDEKEK